ncbi:Uncharacterised protein [Mycobacteroides abscessus subsp. abscessus]|nr:Uncharacterised protein [Mycobacteroides abscessus subsp. abscessus]SKV33958.1 Uncharacterised protein [Mycobacteroides abscessus subsp. abscessus]
MTAIADQAPPLPRRNICLGRSPGFFSSPHKPRTYLSTVRLPMLEPAAVVSLEALKLRRFEDKNASEIASSRDDLPLPEEPVISVPRRLNSML